MPANHAAKTQAPLGPLIRRATARERWWLLSFVILPYASYVGLLIMVGLYISALKQRGKHVWKLCQSMGFGWLALGLLISSSMAVDNKGESFLQLANFLPFFLLFGVLATEPTATESTVTESIDARSTTVGSTETSNAGPPSAHSHLLFGKLQTFAQVLLVTSIPLTTTACLQYVIKKLAIAQSSLIQYIPKGLLTHAMPYEHRVGVIFGNSNALCAYLVIILSFGLGLAIQGLSKQPRPRIYWVQIASLGLCIGAIFATGSRNGLITTLILIAIALYAARTHRWVIFLGLAVSGGLVATAVSLGFGERAMSLALFTQDARVEIWQQSLSLIQQRPLLGWGFTGFRSQYVPYSIQNYATVYHAHNAWLYIASEAGIPVVLGFCFTIGRIYYAGVRSLKQTVITERDRIILFSYLLAFTSCILYELFDVLIHDSRINTPAWAILAAIYSMSHIAQRLEQNKAATDINAIDPSAIDPNATDPNAHSATAF